MLVRSAPIAWLLLVALLAGCASQTPAPTPSLPPLKAEGATIRVEGHGVFASWTGNVSPPAPGTLASNAPVPVDPTSVAAKGDSKSFTFPEGTTIMEAWLNWTDPKASLGFRVVNDTGRTWCGAPFPTNESDARCLAAFYRPPQGKPDGWKATVSAFGYEGAAPAAIPYSLTVLFRNATLPLLGSPASFGADGLVFSAPTLVSKDKHTGEPSLALTPKGTVYVAAPTGAQESLWRSTDGGKTFAFVPIHQGTTDPGSAFATGGGDSAVAVVGESNVYFADQQGGSAETVSASHDGGASWFTQPAAAGPPSPAGIPFPAQPPVGVPNPGVTSADRQWLVADGDSNVWMAFNSQDGATVVHSSDGGRSWPQRGTMKEDNCARGNLVRGKAQPGLLPDLATLPGTPGMGKLYFAGCNADGPGVGVSTDGGLTWTWHLVAKRNGDTRTGFLFVTHIFVVATVDDAGNVYVVWSDEAETPEATGAPPGGPQNVNVWLASSKDGGSTWSKPKKVNHHPGTYVEPWVTAGKAGHVAVAYYGTKGGPNPEQVLGEWYPIVAISEDATSDAPTWREASMTSDFVQYGPVCMRGSACGHARNLLDFFEIQADKDGNVHAVLVDGRNGGSARLSDIWYVKQTGGTNLGGPSVDKNGG